MFIKFASCCVTDQERALAFYEKLGFEKTMDERTGDDERRLAVAPPGGQTGLTLQRDAARAGSGGFVIEVEDINATHARWTEVGVAFKEPPALQPWGMMQALLDDPDGNGIVLVARPQPRS